MPNSNDEMRANPYLPPKMEPGEDAEDIDDRGNRLKAGLLMLLAIAFLFGATVAAMGALAGGYELSSAVATVVFFVASISCSIASVRYL